MPGQADGGGAAAAGKAMFKVSALPAGDGPKQMAQLIIDEFAKAGFSPVQQLAALASAVAESSLDPMAHNTVGEDSVGLFQCNRQGDGLGSKFSVPDLQDPLFNIKVVIDVAKTLRRFTAATTLDDAVDKFVRDLERPRHPDDAVTARQQIARGLSA